MSDSSGGGGLSIQAALGMGQALLRERNPRGATRYFQQVLAADPSNAQALVGLTQAKLALDELSDAGDTADQLARAQPNSVTTYEMKARTYLASRTFILAADAAEEMLRLAPRSLMGFHLLAAARLGQRRHREALNATKEALKIAPNAPFLLAQAGWAAMELRGAWGPARTYIDEAYRLAPTDAYVRYVAAVLAMARGQIKRARELSGSLLRENVNDKNALDLYIMGEGPFPWHRWSWRWTYLCKSAGPFRWIMRGLGWILYFGTILILGYGTIGGVWLLMIGLRFWVAAEQKERRRRAQKHFSAPKLDF